MSTRRALLIGVAQYEHVNALPIDIVINDTNELQRVLSDANIGGFAEVTRLLDREATLPAICKELQQLAESSAEDDTVLIYFSGHGLNDALLPVEYNHSQEAPKLSNEKFSNLLEAIPAKQMVVMLDACHSGSAAHIKAIDSDQALVKQKPLIKSAFSNAAAESLQGDGRIIFTSSKDSEVSHIFKGDRNSVFTKHLIAALEGACVTKQDKFIKVLSVYQYLNAKVLADAQAQGKTQTPSLKADMSHDFVLLRNPQYTPPIQKPEIGEAGLTRDTLRALVKAFSERYPDGPVGGKVWDRAGGDVSRLDLSGNGRTQWHTAFRELDRGVGGVSLESLFEEALYDYPQSKQLIALQQQLLSVDA